MTIRGKNTTKTFNLQHIQFYYHGLALQMWQKVHDTQEIIAPRIIPPKSKTDALSANTSGG